eukprot:1189679-Prorocentrum_minimum.AAC.2
MIVASVACNSLDGCLHDVQHTSPWCAPGAGSAQLADCVQLLERGRHCQRGGGVPVPDRPVPLPHRRPAAASGDPPHRRIPPAARGLLCQCGGLPQVAPQSERCAGRRTRGGCAALPVRGGGGAAPARCTLCATCEPCACALAHALVFLPSSAPGGSVTYKLVVLLLNKPDGCRRLPQEARDHEADVH